MRLPTSTPATSAIAHAAMTTDFPAAATANGVRAGHPSSNDFVVKVASAVAQQPSCFSDNSTCSEQSTSSNNSAAADHPPTGSTAAPNAGRPEVVGTGPPAAGGAGHPAGPHNHTAGQHPINNNNSNQYHHHHSLSPNHSRGSSPLLPSGGGFGGSAMNGNGTGGTGPSSSNDTNGQLPTVGQHAVYVHVNPGETLTVKLADDLQHISGPATVRMVRVNPSLPAPLPLPLHVPPGHIVQQIVDEHGVLRHLILSPQQPPQYPHLPPFPPGMPPPQHQNGPITPANSGYMSGGLNNEFSPSPPMGLPPRPFPGSTTPPQYMSGMDQQESYFNHQQPLQEGGASGDHQWIKLLDKFDRTRYNNYPVNMASGEEQQKLTELLSKIEAPQLRDVGPYEAMLQWTGIDCNDASAGPFPEIEASDFIYEVYMSRSRDSKYNRVYRGRQCQHMLRDLRPATEYFIKLRALIEAFRLQGQFTGPVGFRTAATRPDRPLPPRVIYRSKTSVTLKWTAANPNGSPVSAYHVECDGGVGQGVADELIQWTEVYHGSDKQFKMQKLSPSTTYRFRVAASNAIGKSDFGEYVMVSTSGQAPTAPDPPRLAHSTPTELTLSWIKRGEDESFVLQMDDSETGYGFLNVYTGRDSSTVVSGLRRNSELKFRLSARNEDGESPWSASVTLNTTPDTPQGLYKPCVKGRVLPTSLKVAWDSPKDLGGGEIRFYNLEMREAESSADWTSVYQGQESEHNVTGLRPGTMYAFRVTCNTTGGRSEPSEQLRVATVPVVPSALAKPPSLHSKPKPTALHVKWGPPTSHGGADVSNYEVEMETPDGAKETVETGTRMDSVFSGLINGRTYRFRVRAHNKAGVGQWSSVLAAQTGAGPPDTPVNLRATAKSAHVIQLSWDPPPNDNGAAIYEYRVQFASRRVGGPDVPDSAEASTAGSSPTQSPTKSSSRRPSAGGTTATSQNSSTSSSPVHSLRSSSSCSSGEDWGPWALAYQGASTSAEAKGLQPATDYGFKVNAINVAGGSKFTPVATCTTLAAVPGVVSGLTGEVLSTSEIALSWREPLDNGAPVLEYRVELSPQTHNSEEQQPPAFVSVPAGLHEEDQQLPLTCQLSDLSPETTYRVRVIAVNEVGEGHPGPGVKLTTHSLPPPPPLLEVDKVGFNVLKLKWSDSHSTVEQLNYSLEMENKTGREYDNFSFSPVYEGPFRAHKVQRLNECTGYKFRIRAISETGGTGPWSQPYTFTTCRAPPVAIKAPPKPVEISETSCKLEWAGPPKVTERLLYQLQVCNARLDSEYKTVYVGPSCTETVDKLQPGVAYKARVCLVRRGPGEEETLGPYSPHASFQTNSLHVAKLAEQPGGQSDALEAEAEGAGAAGLTDQQKTLIILVPFAVSAVLIAILAQWLLA